MKRVNVAIDNTHLENDYDKNQRQPIAFAALIAALLVGSLTAILAVNNNSSVTMAIFYFSLSGQAAFLAILALLLFVESVKNSWNHVQCMWRKVRDEQASESRQN